MEIDIYGEGHTWRGTHGRGHTQRRTYTEGDKWR